MTDLICTSEVNLLNSGLTAKCLCHFLFVQSRVEHCERGGAEKTGQSEPGGWRVLVGSVVPRINADVHAQLQKRNKNLRLDVWG